MLAGTAKQLDVQATDQDFRSGLEKTKVKVADISVLSTDSILSKNYKTNGSNNVDLFITSAEMTSLASRANTASSPIKDVRIKFLEGNKMEMSYRISENIIGILKENNIITSRIFSPGMINTALLSPFAASSVNDVLINYLTTVAKNKPIYSKGRLERTSANTIDISIESIQVGRVPLPSGTVKTVESYTIGFVNAFISKDNGFSIEELRIEDGQLYYKGTLPAEISGKELP
ncbi:MAG: hypothetical protein FIA99_08795 [Ruminiclostridium sp.]|nr:hypothetical protein [Ruminiclostridium sp.]